MCVCVCFAALQRIQVLESARTWPRSRRSTSFRTKNSMTGSCLPRPGRSRRAACRLARPYGLGPALGLAWNSGGRLPAAWVELWLAFNKYGQRLRKDRLLSLRLARKAASEAPPTPGGGPVATRTAWRSQSNYRPIVCDRSSCAGSGRSQARARSSGREGRGDRRGSWGRVGRGGKRERERG